MNDQWIVLIDATDWGVNHVSLTINYAYLHKLELTIENSYLLWSIYQI